MADEYGKSSKKVMFYDTDKRHADLKVRLQHDSLTQSAFFRALVSGYLDKDTRIMQFIDDYKFDNNIQNKSERRIAKKMIELGNTNTSAHGLADNEIENIFDILEQEHPEL